jgi:chemotaxis protein methyltransferase WspC
VTSIGKATLTRSVHRRMEALSIGSKEAYIEKLKGSADELKELIEEVVIPETWFFRDNEPFKAMIQYLLSEWVPKHRNNTFRVLSVPCATGEEPYSITMALLSSGWPATKFSVHAVDISSRSIARAKDGIYSQHSFRGSDFDYQSKYFRKSPPYYILKKNVRDKVHFHTGNVLNTPFMEEMGSFDVIFFRNVLIYFDSPSRHEAIATLSRILTDDGILFVGHAEANLLSGSPFTPAPYRQAFAFQKKPKQEQQKACKESAAVKPAPGKGKKAATSHIFPFLQKENNNLPDLFLAGQLADKGELQKATAICEEYLAQNGPAVQAFFLLGIIHDASGNPAQAEKLFRKALYLDPRHEESLVFLTLLAEKKGDFAEAKALKQRISRLQDNSSPRQQNSSIHPEDF